MVVLELDEKNYLMFAYGAGGRVFVQVRWQFRGLRCFGRWEV